MAASISRALARIKEDVGPFLPDEAIERACEAAGHKWRERVLGPVQTLHLFILQVLHFNVAIKGLRRVAKFAFSAGAYCDARARLPLIGDHAELESRAAEAIDPLERLRMLEALSVLTEAHRTAVVAIHLHGRTYQELSDATGVPVATWRTRTFHALRALRAHLEEMEEPDAHSR